MCGGQRALDGRLPVGAVALKTRRPPRGSRCALGDAPYSFIHASSRVSETPLCLNPFVRRLCAACLSVAAGGLACCFAQRRRACKAASGGRKHAPRTSYACRAVSTLLRCWPARFARCARADDASNVVSRLALRRTPRRSCAASHAALPGRRYSGTQCSDQVPVPDLRVRALSSAGVRIASTRSPATTRNTAAMQRAWASHRISGPAGRYCAPRRTRCCRSSCTGAKSEAGCVTSLRASGPTAERAGAAHKALSYLCAAFAL